MEKLIYRLRRGDAANPLSPYGRTKLIIENILQDWVSSDVENHSCATIFQSGGLMKVD